MNHLPKLPKQIQEKVALYIETVKRYQTAIEQDIITSFEQDFQSNNLSGFPVLVYYVGYIRDYFSLQIFAYEEGNEGWQPDFRGYSFLDKKNGELQDEIDIIWKLIVEDYDAWELECILEGVDYEESIFEDFEEEFDIFLAKLYADFLGQCFAKTSVACPFETCYVDFMPERGFNNEELFNLTMKKWETFPYWSE